MFSRNQIYQSLAAQSEQHQLFYELDGFVVIIFQNEALQLIFLRPLALMML